MSSSSTLHATKMHKRQDTLVASKQEFTVLYNALNESKSKDKRVGKKMKFPRRNSLNFPVRKEETPVPEDDVETYTYDLLQNVDKRNATKSAFPISNEIKKALAVLNDASDHQSLSATSATSFSTIDDDEILKVNEFSKGATAISTPVPQQKQKLQIPTAKRRDMAIISTGESPTSVTDNLDLSSLSLNDTKRKSKKKKKSSRDSSGKSRSSSEKSTKSSEKARRRSSKKSRKPRKKVLFKETCNMRRTLSRHDMTPKEIRRAWLSGEEYHRMQIRDEILADRVDMGKCKPGTCIRGLESKIEETACRKLNLRITGSEEVLIEQERQWDEAGDATNFFYDFSSFAYVYGPVSEEALTNAQETARQDRLEAEKILASSAPFRSKGLLRSRFTRRRSWA
mmetsp:Transcript_6079/g.14726  ORF Transcript_6079/g.14726 Transcript_6079/m.14726 type:complete len:397 (+) Transcript_6079:13-1203(+)